MMEDESNRYGDQTCGVQPTDKHRDISVGAIELTLAYHGKVVFHCAVVGSMCYPSKCTLAGREIEYGDHIPAVAGARPSCQYSRSPFYCILS